MNDTVMVTIAIEADVLAHLLDAASSRECSVRQAIEQAICELSIEYIGLTRKWLQHQLARTEDQLEVNTALLEERNRLLERIPACPDHGSQCVPHAIEWVEDRSREEHYRENFCRCCHWTGQGCAGAGK